MTVKLLRSLACLALAAGCGSQSAKPDAPTGGPTDGAPSDVLWHVPGTPGIGAWGLKDYHLGDQSDVLSVSTPPMVTHASGSTILVAVGRGKLGDFASASALPTDNKGNTPYVQLDTTHKYNRWPSGTALYAFSGTQGGSGHTISTFRGGGDEITIVGVEVLEGQRVVDVAWNEDLTPPQTSNTSASVTTTGPATLIAFWFGDGFPGSPQKALAGNDFNPIVTNAYELDSFVQCAVAAKNVNTAGTYNVTWTPDPAQGAQLWLVAVQ